MASFDTKSFKSWTGLVTSVVYFAAWLCTWIALGRMDDDCTVDDPCRALYRPFYWAILQETFVVLFLLVAWLLGVVDRARFALLAFLVLAAVNLEDAGEAMLLNRENDGKTGTLESILVTSTTGASGVSVRTVRTDDDRVNEAIAGYLVLVACNYVYIFILGCVDLFAALKNPLKGWRLTKDGAEPAAHPVEGA